MTADFAERERSAATAFAHMARDEGIERVVYLGGLGEPARSTSGAGRRPRRCSPAEGPPLTYFRAAMVIGAESESYRMLRYLVQRLPAMIAPSWLRNRTQPIAEADVLEYLAQAAERPETAGREVQIGGPDVVTYRELLERDGRRARHASPADGARPAAHAAAVLALDRPGHAGGRRRGAATDRGPGRRHRGEDPARLALRRGPDGRPRPSRARAEEGG